MITLKYLIIATFLQSILTRYCDLNLPAITSSDPITIPLDEYYNAESLGIKGALNGKSLEIHQDHIKFIRGNDTLTYPLKEINQFKYPVYNVVFGKYNSVLPIGPNTFVIAFRFEGDFDDCEFEKKFNNFYLKLTEEVDRRINITLRYFQDD
jgi:hypothetical protein